MWDKIGYLLAVVGFCFVSYLIHKYLCDSGFFIRKSVKSHFECMKQILSPYCSMQETKIFRNKYSKKINEIAKYAKTGKAEREFIEKSRTDYGAYIFPLIFVLYAFPRNRFYSDTDSAAVDSLLEFCKKELLKYKEYAPEIFWSILYLDKENFYKEMVEK